MISACYTMALYCRHSPVSKMGKVTRRAIRQDIDLHGYEEFPHQFTGETWGQCKRQARKRGWIFHRDGEVTCPKCARSQPHNHTGG